MVSVQELPNMVNKLFRNESMKDRGAEMLQGSLQDDQSTQPNDTSDTVMVQSKCVVFI